MDDSARSQRCSWLLGAALVLSTWLAYWPTMSAGFIWDDDAYVVNNVTLQDVAGLRRIWTEPTATPQYYPLVHTSFWIEHQLWGLQPLGYHLVNVLLHALSAVCVWRLLSRWHVPAAWLCAAVFALHPVHVESVAWITERKNVLSGLWYLIAASVYWSFAELAGEKPLRQWNRATWGRYTFAFGAFLLALLSKTVTCSLPAAMLLVLWWRRGTLTACDWLRQVPFFLVGLLFAGVTTYLERTHVGVGRLPITLGLDDRLVLAGNAVWFYLSKLVWPSSLTFIYPKWTISADKWWAWLGLLAALLLLAVLWARRDQLGRGPLVAALYFGGTLLPALGFIDVFPMRYSYVADHFQYLASLGPITLVVSAASHWWNRGGDQSSLQPRLRRVCKVAVAGVGLLLLGALTWRQSLIYHDVETLWRDTLAKNPNAAIAHNNLAKLLFEQGNFDESLEHLEASVRVDPQPESHRNLGVLLAKLGRFDKAVHHYRESLRHEPRSRVHADLARLLAQRNQHDEAVPEFRAAIELTPDDPELRLQLIASLYRLRRDEETLTELNAVAALARDDPRVWFAAGVIWLDRDPVRAVSAFELSAKLLPDFPGTYVRLGLARERIGDRVGAVNAYRRALELNRELPEAIEALHRLGATQP